MLLFAFFLLAASPYDVVIQHGRIVDGTGSPWYSGDIGIRQGRIAAIGNLTGAPAKRTIDARGMLVAPGFIDMLGQSELTILVNPHLPSKIYQGITTEITGEGSSVAPVNDAILAEVNSQRLATAQIMVQARTLSAALMQFQSALQQTRTNLQQTTALRATVSEIKQRLDALEAVQGQPPSLSTTNEPADPLSP